MEADKRKLGLAFVNGANPPAFVTKEERGNKCHEQLGRMLFCSRRPIILI